MAFIDPRPNEFATVPHDPSPQIEIFVQMRAPGTWIVIANKHSAGTAPEVFRSSDIYRGNSADGVARRLKKKRFPKAVVRPFYL